MLKDLLDITKTTANNQGYELKFAGKGFARAKVDQSTTKELKVEMEQSKNFDSTENVIIRGDNTEALKILKQNYHNKIKMIYIDPPYNTGSDEFLYSDDFKTTEKELIEELGLEEETINYLQNIYGTNRHSAWLSFMYPRLVLARDLLTKDGVIFISIDDREQANLKLLCDEVFGEENFIENFYIQVRYSNKSLNEKDNFQKLIEQCLIYVKDKHTFKPKKQVEGYNIDKFNIEIIEKSNGKELELGGKRVIVFKENEYEIKKHKKSQMNLLKATWASGSVLKGNTSGKFFNNYLSNRKIIDGIKCLYKVFNIGEDGLRYRYFTGPKKEKTTKGLFYSGIPLSRIEELENNKISLKEKPIINFYDYSASFGNIINEGGVPFRNGKKPIVMLKSFIEIANLNNSDIVLDFFAGSGTTAYAVMDLNKEDGGNRKFILVQLDEVIKNEGKAIDSYNFIVDNKLTDKRESEEPYISDITIERVNRSGESIKKELDSSGTMQTVDIGYKVFSLVEKPKLKYDDVEFKLFNERINVINALYNMMSATCIELSAKIEEVEKDKLYLINDCYYVVAKCNQDLIDRKKQVYVDGYCNNIDLAFMLNLKETFKNDNIKVVY